MGYIAKEILYNLEQDTISTLYKIERNQFIGTWRVEIAVFGNHFLFELPYEIDFKNYSDAANYVENEIETVIIEFAEKLKNIKENEKQTANA